MGKVSSIEEKLKGINETVFQELCDAFISLKYHKSKAFSRTGSQLGKQKVKKGTPDSFVQLDDGTYLFIESTTQQTRLLEKFKADIAKCFDEKKASIPDSDLREIILCFNSKADLNMTAEVTEYAKPTKVRFISIDDLAIQISLHYRVLAKDYLGLPLDTGQIVVLEKFVKHYNEHSQSIATPINNKLLHRENELVALVEQLNSSDFVVISGAAGVGKTKLTVEAIAEFQKQFGYSAFAVLNKDYDILEDLAYYFDNTSKNILFIDDANRMDRLQQIKGFAEDAIPGSLKIVLTVRDYALDQIRNLIPKVSVFELSSLNEDQIIDIIKGEPFKITYEDHQNKILSISNSNARLAIMAAKLAIEKKNLAVLHEVYDLFNEYFKTFVKDKGLFEDKTVLRSAGVLAYFNTLPLNSAGVLDKTLDKFQLTRSEFIESIDKLEGIEIVEIKFDHAKISDQSISGYFFYKAFFKDDLLSFEVIMSDFYEATKGRIRDTVIPANNTFGYRNIREKIRPILLPKLKSIQSEKDILTFFDLFWFYLEDELLAAVVNKIENSPATEWVYVLDKPLHITDDGFLKLLFEMVRYHPDNDLIEKATALSFEYTKRNANAYSQLVKSVTDNFSIDYQDEHELYKMQTMLFNLVGGKLPSDSFYQQAFFDIANSFLYFRFQQSKPLRGFKYSIYAYVVTKNEAMVKFRNQIWELLESLFSTNPEETFEVLHKYSQNRLDTEVPILLSDFTAVEKIIGKYFKVDRFDHAYLLQELCSWAKRLKIVDHPLQKFQKSFFTEKYKLFRKVDWNRLRDKEQHEYNSDEKYEVVKTREIRSSFRFASLEEYNSFIDIYCEINLFKKGSHEIFNSLAIILDENIIKNPRLSIEIFKKLVKDKRLDNFCPYLPIKTMATEVTLSDEFWRIIKPLSRIKTWFNRIFGANDDRISALSHWQLHFLLSLPAVNKEKYRALISVIKALNASHTLYLDGIEKYEEFKAGTIEKILRIVSLINQRGHIKVSVWHRFFEDFKNYLSDVALLKLTYIQQDVIQQLFDYDGEDLLFVLKKDPNFLFEYINSFDDHDITRRSSDYKCFQVAWDLDSPEPIVMRVLNHLIENDKLGLNSDFLSAFFVNIKPANQSKANDFLMSYVSMYFKDNKKMNAIFELIDDKLKHLFPQAFKAYLRLNSNVDDFKKIEWTGSGIYIHDGSSNMGDMKAAKWQRILDLVVAEDLGIGSIQITTWVKEQIELEKRSGDRFRKWAFLGEW